MITRLDYGKSKAQCMCLNRCDPNFMDFKTPLATLRHRSVRSLAISSPFEVKHRQ